MHWVLQHMLGIVTYVCTGYCNTCTGCTLWHMAWNTVQRAAELSRALIGVGWTLTALLLSLEPFRHSSSESATMAFSRIFKSLISALTVIIQLLIAWLSEVGTWMGWKWKLSFLKMRAKPKVWDLCRLSQTSSYFPFIYWIVWTLSWPARIICHVLTLP